MSPLSITIAIPAFNEEQTLEPMIQACLEIFHQPGIQSGEILIVDDGSTDGTGAVAERLAGIYSNLRVHRHPGNRGFAAVQKSCYKHALGDWVFLIPADGQVAPSEINRFLALCDTCDLMFGVAESAPERGLRTLQTGLYHAFVDAFFNLRLGLFGACVMVRRELVQSLHLKSKSPVLMTELAVRARAAGARVTTVPVDKKPRKHGTAKGGKMLRLTPAIVSDLASLYVDVVIKKQKPRTTGEGEA